MNTIGLGFGDMVALQASVWQEARNTIETDASYTRYIKMGLSEDEARFRSEITAQISSITTAFLKVIEANNRILSDLKMTGVISD